MTLAGSVSALLQENWTLTGDLATAKVRFTEGWYDKTYEGWPQLTISELVNPVGKFYGSATVDFYPRFLANCWLTVPRGSSGTLEYAYAESMRREVARIVNANRHGIAAFNIVSLEDEGTPHHELDEMPRVLRYEVTIFAVRTL